MNIQLHSNRTGHFNWPALPQNNLLEKSRLLEGTCICTENLTNDHMPKSSESLVFQRWYITLDATYWQEWCTSWLTMCWPLPCGSSNAYTTSWYNQFMVCKGCITFLGLAVLTFWQVAIIISNWYFLYCSPFFNIHGNGCVRTWNDQMPSHFSFSQWWIWKILFASSCLVYSLYPRRQTSSDAQLLKHKFSILSASLP